MVMPIAPDRPLVPFCRGLGLGWGVLHMPWSHQWHVNDSQGAPWFAWHEDGLMRLRTWAAVAPSWTASTSTFS